MDASVGLQLAENVFDAYPTLQTFRQVVNYLLARVSRRYNIASLCTYSILYLGFVNKGILSFCSASTALLHCAVCLIRYWRAQSPQLVNRQKPIKEVTSSLLYGYKSKLQCDAMGGLSVVALSRQNVKLVSTITCICGNHRLNICNFLRLKQTS